MMMYLICAVYIASSHLGIIVEACNYFESCKYICLLQLILCCQDEGICSNHCISKCYITVCLHVGALQVTATGRRDFAK